MQPFTRFVPFVRARGRVPQRLGEFIDVKNYGNMIGTAKGDPLFKSLHHAGIIPSFAGVNKTSCILSFGPKSLQCLGNTSLGSLQIDWDADAEPIVPDGHSKRYLHHAGGVDGLEKHPFRCTRLTDGTKCNLISRDQTFSMFLKFRIFPDKLGSLGHPKQTGNLPSSGRQIRGRILHPG